MKTLFRYLIVTLSITATANVLASERGYYSRDRGYYSDHHNYSDRHNHRSHSSNDAAYLVGGVLLGAAIAELADSPRRTTYTTSYPSSYSSRYPSTYSSTTTYYSEPYSSEPYYPETYTTTTYTRSYPAPVYRERVYSRDVVRGERGTCYEVSYYDGRRTLTEIPRYNCRRH